MNENTPPDLQERLALWLRETLDDEPPPSGVALELLTALDTPEEEIEDPASLASLWSAMTALAQETRLQGRAFSTVRDELAAAAERTAGLLERHEEALSIAQESGARTASMQASAERAAADAVRREVAELLADLHDRLLLGAKAVQEVRLEFENRDAASPPPRGLLARLFGQPPQPPDPPSLAPIGKGYELGLDRLGEVLAKWDIRPVGTPGTPFDPRTMNALDVADDPEAEDGAVLEVLRPGYTWKGEPFRTAQVRVCRKKR
ncbi:MAG: nucleotide exchange factor GrpE [Sumerlaeia bacterium]